VKKEEHTGLNSSNLLFPVQRVS